MKDIRGNIKLVGNLKNWLNKRHSIMLSLAEVGANLYGWKTKDSDTDLRGIHAVNTFELFRLKRVKDVLEDRNIDYVSFEIKKAMNLLIKNNFNVVEDIFAEQIVTTPYFLELKKLMKNSITKQISHGYKGCATSNYKKFIASENTTYKSRAVKKYLYVLRSLMAGIYVLEEEKVESNIGELNKHFNIDVVNLLLEKKLNGEKEISNINRIRIEKKINQLYEEIDEAYVNSNLPDELPNEEINKFENLLKKIRMELICT